MMKRYLVWALVERQPNVVEKLAGTIRRSPKFFQLARLYYGPSGREDTALFAVEVRCDEKGVERLTKIYRSYVEVIDVWFKEITEGRGFMEGLLGKRER